MCHSEHSEESTFADFRKQALVLFICVGNTCRSQMAEALFNHYAPEGWTTISAGTQPGKEVHPLALKALKEIGIEHQGRPKPLTGDMLDKASVIVAVCSQAEACPVVPGKNIEHWGIPDPFSPNDDKYLPLYREARDIIKEKVLKLVEKLAKG